MPQLNLKLYWNNCGPDKDLDPSNCARVYRYIYIYIYIDIDIVPLCGIVGST